MDCGQIPREHVDANGCRHQIMRIYLSSCGPDTNDNQIVSTAAVPKRGMGERVHVFSHLSHLYPQGASLYTTYIFRHADTPEETLSRWQAMKRAASEAVVAHGGTISHQHGVGTDHMPYLKAEKGPLGIRAIQSVLKTFDPRGIMNPGKLVP